MKIGIRTILQPRQTLAVMTHGQEELLWNISMYDRSEHMKKFDLFEEINKHWAWMPEKKQAEVFGIYAKISGILNRVFLVDELIAELQPLVSDLLALHPVEAMEHWLRMNTSIRAPITPMLPETVEASGDNLNRVKRTYTREDYHWLTAMTFTLRTMVPIWGQFVANTEMETGTRFKEDSARELILTSNIEECAPMQRLKTFIEYTVTSEKTLPLEILGGVSTEDFPDHMLGLILVRRLTTVDIRGVEPQPVIVHSMYKFIQSRLKNQGNRGPDTVKPKSTAETSNTDSQVQISMLERVKVRRDVSAGDLAPSEFQASRPEVIAQALAPDMDLRLLEESLRSVQELADKHIRPPQAKLASWIVARQIPPRARLKKNLMMNLIAVAQSILWHRGHHDLAALVSAYAQTSNNVTYLSGPSSQGRLKSEHAEALTLLYPFVYKQPGEKKGNKPISPGVLAVESMAAQLTGGDWRLTLPDSWIEQLPNNRNGRRYAAPYDIKTKIAVLAIAIARRSL